MGMLGGGGKEIRDVLPLVFGTKVFPTSPKTHRFKGGGVTVAGPGHRGAQQNCPKPGEGRRAPLRPCPSPRCQAWDEPGGLRDAPTQIHGAAGATINHHQPAQPGQGAPPPCGRCSGAGVEGRLERGGIPSRSRGSDEIGVAMRLTYLRNFFSGGDFRSQPEHTTSPPLIAAATGRCLPGRSAPAAPAHGGRWAGG